MPIKLTILLIIALMIVSGSQRIDDSLALKVGERVNGKSVQQDNYKSFQFININEIPKKYLFVIAGTNFQRISMNIYQYGGDVTIPIVSCGSDGVIDECSIPQQKLVVNSTLLVAIQCQDQCKYVFYSYWSDVQNLEVGRNSRMMFDEKGNAQLYHMNLKDMNFSELRVTLIPQTKRMPTDQVKIYGKYDYSTDPTEEQYDFKSVDLWDDGQGIFLSKKQMKSEKISLLVVGQTQTVFSLKTQLKLLETYHDVEGDKTFYQHLQPNSNTIYFVKFPTIVDTDYIISFSTFSGDLEVKCYLDAQFTKQYYVRPHSYMGDSKMVLNTQEQGKIRQIYIQVKSDNTNTIYMADFNVRKKSNGIQLDENINQFIHVPDREIVYLHYQKWNTQVSTPSQLTINLLVVKGSVKPQFRLCTSLEIWSCISIEKYINTTKVIQHYDSTNVGLKNIYKFSIDDQFTQLMNKVEKVGYMVIVLDNLDQKPKDNEDNLDQKPKDNEATVVIEYNHQNYVENIREDRPMEDIIKAGEIKYYRYVNSDTSVKQIKFHLNQISGNVEIQTLRIDPRSKQIDANSFLHTLSFTQNITKPIYAQIHALTQSIFGITVQTIHPNIQQSNAITISEDLEFTLKLKPLSSETILMQPLFQKISFQYKSSGTIMVCPLKNAENLCQNEVPQIKSEGSINIVKNKNNKNFDRTIKIENPSKDRSVVIKMIYHSINKELCSIQKLDRFDHKVVKYNQCLSFKLDHKASADLDVFFERVDIGKVKSMMHVCGIQHKITQNQHQRVIIKQQQIKQYCKLATPTNWVLEIIFIPSQDNSKSFKVEYLVQYVHNLITLPDGIAYRTQAITQQSAVKHFYYELLNKVDTEIIVTSHSGKVQFYALLIQQTQKLTARVSKQQYQYKPNTPNYYSDPTLLIKGDQITCIQCGLLIAVYSQEIIGKMVDFSIQVTQNSITLKDHNMKSNYLLKDSLEYYNYYHHRNNSSFIVTVSDNNQRCTKIFLSKMDFPSESNNLQVENGNQMVYYGEQGQYFIGIQAIESCLYSISVQSTDYRLTKLERGTAAHIQLKYGEVSYFMFQHMANIDFKLLSMHIHGDVDIYLNPYNDSHIIQLNSNSNLDVDKFIHHSKNTLIMKATDEGFCWSCYYIVGVVAVQQTQSSLVLADQETPIMLTSNKKLYDEIQNKQGINSIHLPAELRGSLQIEVFSGIIQLSLSSDNKSQSPRKYSKMNSLQHFKFDLSTDENKFTWQPLNLKVKCLENRCIYAIKLQSNELTQLNSKEVIMVPGKPTFIYLQPKKTLCLNGFISDKKEKIIFTTNRFEEDSLDILQYNVKISTNTKIELERNIIKNVMAVNFKLQGFVIQNTQPYSICIQLPPKATSAFVATVEQASDVNLLPQDVQTTVTNHNTFVIYPLGPYIIDLFQCSGNAMIAYGSSEQLLTKQTKMSSLEQAGIAGQSHAIKLESDYPVFLKIESSLSLVRWIHVQKQKERGLGYMMFKIGQMKYDGSRDYIVVHLQTLKKDKQQQKISKNTMVKEIHYTAYISNNKDHLKSATQCQRFLQQDVMVVSLGPLPQQQQINSETTLLINKKQVMTKFVQPQNLYINIVADLKLLVPKIQGLPDFEDYRFIYTQQEIPLDIFTKTDEQEFNLILWIFLVGLSIFGVIVFAYLLATKIVPLISRIRNRNLVEQKPDEKDGAEVIPPSSDRQRITVNKKVFDDKIEPAQNS